MMGLSVARRQLPDLRFVYRDWGGPERAFHTERPICGRRHCWTIIALDIMRVARAAGLSRPNWYCGPTGPDYCERCGVYRDQDRARRQWWRMRTLLAMPRGSFVDAA